MENRTPNSDSAQSGFLELKSGRWQWRLSPSDEGSFITFKRTGRHRDEMKTWLDPAEAGGIVEAARNAVYRTWEDYDGVIWLTGLEFASLSKDSATWITFRNAVCELAAPMPPGIALGDLTLDEMMKLLKSAS